MKISLTTKEPLKITTDLLIIFVSPSFSKELTFLDQKTLSQIKLASALENFTGKEKQSLILDTSLNESRKLLLYGIGEGKIDDIYNLQNIVAQAIKQAQGLKRKKIALMTHSSWYKIYTSEIIAQKVTEAVLLSTYSFDKYKGEDYHQEKTTFEEITILTTPPRLAAFERGIELAKLYSLATTFTRDLVNEPAQVTTPSYLAKIAQEIAKKERKIKVSVLEKKEIEKLNLEALLAVAKGSDEPPKFVRLSYKPKASTLKKVVLVGKGITFDTGGLSLKPSSSMETMKLDMAGAATVLGIFSQIAELKPNIELVGLLPLCENMPGSRALKPGDILKSLNGKTIEVINTDAEGRLILADALSYAVIFEKPEMIFDIATLTGAIRQALGEDIIGFFSNSEELSKKIKDAASSQGEVVWQMPLFKDYKNLLKSEIADLRNISKSKYAGAITAALFLEEFVDKIPWVHLDIAGPAFNERNTPLCSYGGTGSGVRLLLHLLTSS